MGGRDRSQIEREVIAAADDRSGSGQLRQRHGGMVVNRARQRDR